KSNLTGVCGRMEAAGLLTRSASPGDQRAYALELTPAGRDILEHVEGPYRERIRSFMQGFDDQEIARFTEYLTRLQRELIRQEEERP
ncbi:MarR family winged helix-turn-helix transcriptional regulator, partial [Victivallis vadensis]